MLNEQNTEALMNNIYTSIHNIIAPVIEKETVPPYIFNMMSNGIPVQDTFDINAFGNDIPSVSKSYAGTSRSVKDVYATILSAECPPDNEEAAKRKKNDYDNAIKLLYSNYNNLEESSLYQAYQKTSEAYNEATYIYYAEYNKNIESQNKVELKKAKDKMDAAFRKVVSYGKTQVENAINTMAAYNAFTPRSIFAKAAVDYGNVIDFDVKTIPELWSDNKSVEKLAWKKVEISVSKQTSKIHTAVANTSSNFSSEYKHGFWIFYSERGKKESADLSVTNEANSNSDMFSMTITMEVASVKLIRPWLNLSLLGYTDVYLPGKKPSSITNGTLIDTDCMLPILPDFLILARDIKIYGDFSGEEQSMFETIKSRTESSTSFGPFSTNPQSFNFYDSTQTKDSEWARFDSPFKIDFSEVPQVIGVLSSIVKPAFPKIDGSGM